jgi:drug/metabolite transporter (DMT)-like permease
MPFPSLVVAFQLSATIVFIYTAKYAFQLPVDPLERRYIIPYLYYIVAFAAGVFCNMKSLSMSNVETVIVFRALSPCLVSILDALFLGREWPSRRSQIGLATIVVGAYGYASYDAKFQTQGLVAYVWPTLYLLIISFEMAYGKRIIRSVDLKTKSGPVLYTNLLGIFPMLMFAVMAGEPRQLRLYTQPIAGIAYAYLLLGCAVGTGIGYSSWWCRDQVSATSFTIIGVMNKCLTVVLNVSIWDQHAPPGGIACLAICLVGGTIYQQAPMRSLSNSAAVATVAANADVWDTMTEEGSERLTNNIRSRSNSLSKSNSFVDDAESQAQSLLGSGMKQRKN